MSASSPAVAPLVRGASDAQGKQRRYDKTGAPEAAAAKRAQHASQTDANNSGSGVSGSGSNGSGASSGGSSGGSGCSNPSGGKR